MASLLSGAARRYGRNARTCDRFASRDRRAAKVFGLAKKSIPAGSLPGADLYSSKVKSGGPSVHPACPFSQNDIDQSNECF
jgi:hypothetical protein